MHLVQELNVGSEGNNGYLYYNYFLRCATTINGLI